MSNKVKIPNEELDFLNELWERQSFYHSDNVPYQWHNVDNGMIKKESTIHLRAQLMYSKHGFFAESLQERNTNTLRYQNIVHGPDQPHFHRQRRYLIQQYIDNDGNFNGPVHISVRPKLNKNKSTPKELSNDYEDVYDKFMIITHPGHTRLEAAAYLQSPMKNAIITINKEHDYGEFLSRYKRIENPRELKNFWKKPTIKHLSRILEYDEEGNPKNKLLPPISEIDYHMIFHLPNHPKIPGETKYHSKTECFVLKLWCMYPSYLGIPLREVINTSRELNLIMASNYLYEVWESSKGITYRLFEKQLTIYTNSDDNVKEHLYEQRNKLKNEVRKLQQIFKRRNDIPNTYKLNADKPFTFDVVVVDEKPKNISELNENKGFAIWLDKSIISDFNREIYELLFFTRVDVKLAKTKDGKIEVINCGCSNKKEWIIPENYIKAI